MPSYGLNVTKMQFKSSLAVKFLDRLIGVAALTLVNFINVNIFPSYVVKINYFSLFS